MRVSTYVATVDVSEEHAVLVQGYLGAVDLVDRELSRFLDDHRDTLLDLEQLPKDLADTLFERGYLTELAPEEEEMFVEKISVAHHELQQGMTNIFFLPAYACNLRCPYCFELGLYKNGNRYMNNLLTPRQVDQAFDTVDEMKESGLVRKVNPAITLFGGEPLMEVTGDIVRYIVDAGAKRGFHFKAITNGVQLNQFEDILHPKLLNSLQITIDGVKDVHEQTRRGPGFWHTYDTILNNIRMALAKQVNISVRINVGARNFAGLDELVKEFKNEGFMDNPAFSINLHEIHSVPDNLTVPVSSLLEWTEKQKRAEPGLPIYFDSGIISQLRPAMFEGKPFTMKSGYCGAYTGNLLFDSHGEIHTCLSLVGNPSGRIARYDPEFIKEDNWDMWRGRHVMSNPGCRSCRYALLCGGGCAEQAQHVHGDFHASFCRSYDQLFSSAVRRLYQEWKSSSNVVHSTVAN